MKKIIFLLVLISTPALIAQNFSIAVSPQEQTCYVGDKIHFSVEITPINNFDATVYLSTRSSLNGSISSSFSNPPHKIHEYSITPNVADTGTYVIEIIGKNIIEEVRVQCTLTVLPLGYWKYVSMPVQGLLTNITLSPKGRCSGAKAHSGNEFTLCEYIEGDWKCKSIIIPNGLEHYGMSFAFDKNENIWIGENGKLTKYDGSHLYTTEFGLKFGKNDHLMNYFAHNKYGDLFYAISDHSEHHVAKYHNDVWHLIAKDIPYSDIMGLCVTGDSNVWISYNSAVGRVNNGVVSRTTNIAGKNVGNVSKILSHDDKVYCLSSSGLFVNENDVWSSISLPLISDWGKRMNMAISNSGEIYISVEESGLYIRYADSTWGHLSPVSSPIGKSFAHEILIDKFNNVWMQVYEGSRVGFVVYNPTGIRTFLITTSVNDNDDNVTGFINNSLDIKQTQNALHITLPEEREQVVDVYDMQGNKVIQYNLSGINEKECELNISSLMNGIYIVRVGQRNAKLLINR